MISNIQIFHFSSVRLGEMRSVFVIYYAKNERDEEKPVT